MVKQDLQLTWEDVAELVGSNPLAAEQLKSIALRRKVAELQESLSMATESRADGEVVPDTGESSEGQS